MRGAVLKTAKQSLASKGRGRNMSQCMEVNKNDWFRTETPPLGLSRPEPQRSDVFQPQSLAAH